MQKYDDFRKSGAFKLAAGADVPGELSLKGSRTSLDLYSNAFFDTHSSRDIFGTFHDLSKVSLIECVTTSGPGHGTRGGESYHFSRVFPHFALFGEEHITSEDRKIREVSFAVDDAETLFYDFDAFGWVINARPHMERIAKDQPEGREIEIGEHPEIFYFTGRNEIFSVSTVLGKISAWHSPTITSPGPRGIRVHNTIKLNIAFDSERTVREAISCLIDVLRFLEVIAGRPQNLTTLVFNLSSTEERPSLLDAYWCMPPRRNVDDESWTPHPADLPLQAARDPTSFTTVLARWLERQDTWRDARSRFATAFSNQNQYGIERLVAAANMFDILPPSADPAAVPLSREVEEARDNARKAFRDLPASPERDSILGALGRIGKPSLKRKVRSRVRMISDVISARFPELDLVVDQAVDCRNFYVHGSIAKIDYGQHDDQISFFTNTLEFVFAASDLVESGWDIGAWAEQSSTLSHPFDQYRMNYSQQLAELKKLL